MSLLVFAVFHANYLFMQGFKTTIDTKNEYPITTRGPILIKPGQVVISILVDYILFPNISSILQCRMW